MTASELIDFTSSPNFVRTVSAAAIASVFLAITNTVVALSNYGRGREGTSPSDGAPWPLIVGTWRDSFILSLLYVASSMLRDGLELQKVAFGVDDTQKLLMPFVTIVGGLILHLLVIMVASVRIFALSKWLRETG